jgi:phenylacetate-CoA ligase
VGRLATVGAGFVNVVEAALHPSVELTLLASERVAIRDGRTGLEVVLEGLTPPLFAGDDSRVPAGPLADVCEQLGLRADCVGFEERQRTVRAQLHADDQDERLRELVARVTARVPYYRNRPSSYDPAAITGIGALRHLPLITKSVVRSEFEALIFDDESIAGRVAAGDWELVSTSGTTEDRLSAIADMELPRIPSEYETIWRLPHFDHVPRTAVLTSPVCMGSAGCSVAALSRDRRIKKDHTLFVPTSSDLFSIDDDGVRAVVAELHDFAPDFLLVNPVYAHWIGRRALELGLSLPPMSLVLSSYQYASSLQRRTIERIFRAPVRNMYAATELGGCQIGLECGAGHLHAREDHCVVEIVPAERVPAGEPGRVVVTTLASRSMPLLRYAVGDLASWMETPCSCPMQDWPTFLLHGREQETLQLGSRRLTVRQLDNAIAREESLDFYTCRQEGDDVTLDVIPALGGSLEVGPLARRLEAELGHPVTVRLRRRLDPAPSLKFPLIERSARELAP